MQMKTEDKSMTRKLDLLWIGTKNKISSLVEDFKTEEAGAAEIVAIILIIVAVIAAAGIFKTQLTKLVTNIFDKIKL